MLNYGYTVVRAAIARAIVGAGLIPSLGLFHRSRSNAFCLADDLIEPFRPYVDWRVYHMVDQHGSAPDLKERDTRAQLLSLFHEGVIHRGKRVALLTAIDNSATSLALALTAGSPLELPTGLALAMADDEPG